MLLSIYTYVKNGLINDLHVVDMLKHHLPLADEIVINEGYSTDGTFEKISAIDPKIRIFRNQWAEPSDQFNWYIPLKDAPRHHCRGEWCLHLDADEFVPEWEFEQIRQYIASAKEDLIPANFVNFYGNYKVYHHEPRSVSWPAGKMILHRNRPDIEFWGDGSNVRLKDQPFDWNCSPMRFTVHHFGAVRNAARLRQKWHIQGAMYKHIRRWFNLPMFLFKLRPHSWKDPQFLPGLRVYEGPHVKAVRDNPDEFVRDGLEMYDYLRKQAPARSAPVQVSSAS
jgi:hypothetical protein